MLSKLASVFFALAGACAHARAQPLDPDAATRRYTVQFDGRPVGEQLVADMDPRTIRVRYAYADRGQGPTLDSSLALDQHDLPVWIETIGTSYRQQPVGERFVRTRRDITWSNRGERGSRRTRRPGFYLSMDAVPEEMAILARALLAAPNHQLALFPEGRANLVKGPSVQLRQGQVSLRIHHHSITGIDLTPTEVWLDDQGQLFAIVTDSLTTVAKHWEQHVPRLAALQREIRRRRERAWAQQLANRSDAPVAFRGVNLFDSATGETWPNHTVGIRGNRISVVGPDSEVRLGDGTRVIDARGKTLIPGLWDMHTHVRAGDGPLHIAAGVTSVRDLGNKIDVLAERQKAFDGGTAIGPRIVATGSIDGPGPYAAPTDMLVDTLASAHAAIDRYAAAGYGQIKVYSSITPQLVAPIATYAHTKGMLVSGHVPAFMSAERAVTDGFDELQHLDYLFLNFLAQDQPKLDTRTPLRFKTVAYGAAGLELRDPEVMGFVRMLADLDIVVDPTVTIFESMFTDRARRISAVYARVATRLPSQVRRRYLGGGLRLPKGRKARHEADRVFRNSYRKLLDMVALLHHEGVPLVAGTDALAGFTLHRELENYVAAGIPAADVLRIATLGAATVAGVDHELGSIETGKLADLVLIDGDPTESISEIRKVLITVRDGTIYHSEHLYAAMGLSPL
ncbi:MAG: amidohydrolase family protein [Nannocystaceae bacterium]